MREHEKKYLRDRIAAFDTLLTANKCSEREQSQIRLWIHDDLQALQADEAQTTPV